jgi:hypothetical protein
MNSFTCAKTAGVINILEGFDLGLIMKQNKQSLDCYRFGWIVDICTRFDQDAY